VTSAKHHLPHETVTIPTGNAARYR